MAVEFTTGLAGVDMAKAEAVIVLNLTVAEQRKVVEHLAGGACFRMLVKKSVWETAKKTCPAWQFGTLKDGRHIMWQPYTELNKLRRGPMQNGPLYNEIRSAIIGDEVE
jgi:hypothetical protein